MLSALQGMVRRRESGTALALFRIGVGLTILCSVGRTVLYGLAPAVWLDADDGGLLPLGEPPWQIELLGGLTPQTMWGLVGVTLFFALLVTLGLGGRFSVFVLSQAYLGLSFINEVVQGCDDKLISNALWLLVLARCTATLSLDCRLRNGTWTSAEPVPAWPRYLAVWQIVIVYFTTGLQKVSIHWTPAGGFSALYWILQEPSWQRWDMHWLAWVYPATQLATATTWFWEITFPAVLLAMYFRRTAERGGRLRWLFNRLRIRDLYLAVGVMLHLGVWLFNDIGPFTWITLSFYFCLLRPNEWNRLWAFLRRRPKSLIEPHDVSAVQPAFRGRHWAAGVFVVFHLAAVTLGSSPVSPGAMNRNLWESPAVQREFVQWSEALGSMGLDVTPLELERFLWEAGRAYIAVRDRIVAPFAPYYRYTGARQGWPMFTGPDTAPTRLSVEIEEQGNWRTVYVQRQPNYDWRAGQLGQEHVRTAIHAVAEDPESDSFRSLAAWIAVRAAADFPQATRVRVSSERLRVLPPEAIRTGHRHAGDPLGGVSIALQ